MSKPSKVKADSLKRARERRRRAAWRLVRRKFLASHPWCCVMDCDGIASEVEHIESPIGRPDLQLAWSNLRGFCQNHHEARLNAIEIKSPPGRLGVGGLKV